MRLTHLSCLKAVLCFAIVCIMTQCACASPEDVRPLADAASKMQAGDTASTTGARKLAADLDANVSQTGDQTLQKRTTAVDVQRNTSATGAGGSTYSAVTLNVSGGAAAIREAIAADPVIALLRQQIDVLSRNPDAPASRMDELRTALETRLREIESASAKASPSITIGDVTQTVTAPSNVTSTPTPLNEHDVKSAPELGAVIKASNDEPDSQPVSPDPAKGTIKTVVDTVEGPPK